MTEEKKTSSNAMDELLDKQKSTLPIPRVGDLVEGEIISISKNEIYIDLTGITTGIIRGKEIYDESGGSSDLKVEDKISATVIALDNENGYMELSLREAGHKKAWDNLEKLHKNGEIVPSKIIDANKGGLMVKVGNVIGFLPVSQLSIDHYPRIEGGDKNKILAHLKEFIGEEFKAKIIDINEKEEKLIVSEKAAWNEKQKKAVSKYKKGDKVKGKITGVVDFGAFVEFGNNLEGLIHISELAWQRIDNPRNIVKVDDIVDAEIIDIEDSKISLSIKKLQTDPWVIVTKKYKPGQTIKGVVLKVNPFGAFVELDDDIHGLVHISELSEKKINNPKDIITVGKKYEFTILSIEPDKHRLGLSLKTTDKKEEEKKKKVKNKEEKKVEEKKDKEDKKDNKNKEEKKVEEKKDKEDK